jgi:hypothetical protein
MPAARPHTAHFRRIASAPSSRPGSGSGSQPSRTLAVAASGTALVMAIFSAFVVNVGDSARAFHAGVAGEAWGLSGMSLGAGRRAADRRRAGR